jgi:hypothetical protein
VAEDRVDRERREGKADKADKEDKAQLPTGKCVDVGDGRADPA